MKKIRQAQGVAANPGNLSFYFIDDANDVDTGQIQKNRGYMEENAKKSRIAFGQPVNRLGGGGEEGSEVKKGKVELPFLHGLITTL